MLEQVGREDVVVRLGFLQAQDVGLLLVEEALDDRRSRARTELMFQEAILSLVTDCA